METIVKELDELFEDLEFSARQNLVVSNDLLKKFQAARRKICNWTPEEIEIESECNCKEDLMGDLENMEFNHVDVSQMDKFVNNRSYSVREILEEAREIIKYKLD